MVLSWFRSDPERVRREELYRRISADARHLPLFADLGVPDTVEGRFESLALHVALVLRRLRALGPEGKALAQEIVDMFFTDLDGAVRQLGVGDLSVGKKVKAFAQGFYGRASAYDDALAITDADGALERAIARNLLGAADGVSPHAPALARHVRAIVERLDRFSIADFLDGATLYGEERAR